MAGFSRTSQRIDLLPPERPRPARPAPRVLRAFDVVDADFEVVALSRMPHAANTNSVRTAPPPAGTGPLHAVERRLRRISPRVFAGLTIALCTVAFLSTIALAPSQPQAAKTLGIGDIRTDLQDADGLKVVAVYGTVVNPTAERRDIPQIRVDMLAASGRITAEAQLAGSRVLAPGESRPFSARLPHAGGSTPTVEISFAGTGASPR